MTNYRCDACGATDAETRYVGKLVGAAIGGALGPAVASAIGVRRKGAAAFVIGATVSALAGHVFDELAEKVCARCEPVRRAA